MTRPQGGGEAMRECADMIARRRFVPDRSEDRMNIGGVAGIPLVRFSSLAPVKMKKSS